MESTGADHQGSQSDQQLQKEISSCKRVALIAGVTGIVGAALAELLTKDEANWKVYGVSKRPLPPWLQHLPIHHIQCDLLDRHQSVTSLSPLSDVTHLFFVTWTSRSTEQENCIANSSMLQNTLEPILFNCKHFKHICLQTGIKHYIGSHLAYSSITPPVYVESAPRLSDPNFYYAQEDLLHDLLCSPRLSRFQNPITWSVHRPGLIFGLSPLSYVNSTVALAIYASICKYECTPLVFTGSQITWDSHLNTSDSLLIAEQEIWASTHAHAHNQAFNVSNGDNVTWKELWSVIALHFGIKLVPFLGQPQSFVKLMQDKTHVWEEMVEHYGLFPTKLMDFLGGWQVLDTVFHQMPTGKSSMEKSKKFGFNKSIDTKDSLVYWFERMRVEKLIP